MQAARKNEPGEIEPRSNLGACKKRCNAVTTPVIAIPYRDGKRWSRQNLYNAPLMLAPYFLRALLNRIKSCGAIRLVPFRVLLRVSRWNRSENRSVAVVGAVSEIHFEGTENFAFDSRCSVRLINRLRIRNRHIRASTHRKCRFFGRSNAQFLRKTDDRYENENNFNE